MNNDSIEQAADAGGETNSEARVRKVQIFRAKSIKFGVFESEIATIAEWREPTPLPYAPGSVLGVVSIQGRMLTVLDLPLLAGTETNSAEETYNYILALRGDEQLALAVSDLEEAVESASYVEPELENKKRFELGVLSHAGAEVRILNTRELFPAALQGRERRRRRF